MTTISPAREERAPQRPDEISTRRPSLRHVCIAAVLIGLALRLVQYLANGSLYVDEAAVASSLVTRDSLTELFSPLDYGQTAPPGFLLFEFLAVRAFGSGEYALRFYSLAMGLTSLVLFWQLGQKTLSRFALVVAVALFSTSHYLIYFSATVKQYTGDATFTIGLLLVAWFTLHRQITWRWAAIMAGVGAVSVWFSHPQLLMLPSLTLGLGWILFQEGRSRDLRRFALVTALWGVNAIAAFLMARSLTTEAGHLYFQAFWQTGFVPTELSARPLLWFAILWFVLFDDLLFSPVAGLAFFAGWIALSQKDRRWSLLLALPLTGALIASAVRLYPLGSHTPSGARVLVFLIPILVLLVAEGADLARKRYRFHPSVDVVLILLLIIFPVYRIASAFPFERDHLRAVLAEVHSEVRHQETIYVHYTARAGYEYYAPRLGLDGYSRVNGTCARTNARIYLEELGSISAGGRIWFIFGSRYAVLGVNEKELILEYLNAHGTLLREINSPSPNIFRHQVDPGASALLYHIADGPWETDFTQYLSGIDNVALASLPEYGTWSCHGIWGEPNEKLTMPAIGSE